MGALVSRIMVDLHTGMQATALVDEGEEAFERFAFCIEVVRPDRGEPLMQIDHAEEVVDAPHLADSPPPGSR